MSWLPAYSTLLRSILAIYPPHNPRSAYGTALYQEPATSALLQISWVMRTLMPPQRIMLLCPEVRVNRDAAIPLLHNPVFRMVSVLFSSRVPVTFFRRVPVSFYRSTLIPFSCRVLVSFYRSALAPFSRRAFNSFFRKALNPFFPSALIPFLLREQNAPADEVREHCLAQDRNFVLPEIRFAPYYRETGRCILPMSPCS